MEREGRERGKRRAGQRCCHRFILQSCAHYPVARSPGVVARRDSIRFAPTDFQNRRRPRTADASSEDVLTETMFMLSFKMFEESA